MNISGYTIEPLYQTDPIRLFEEYSMYQYSSLFIGGGEHGQYSFIGAIPHCIIEYDQKSVSITYEKSKETIDSTLYQSFEKIFNHSNIHTFEYPISLCGFIGFLSYQASKEIEKLSNLTVKPYPCPIAYYILYNTYIIIDHSKKIAYKINLIFKTESKIIRERKNTHTGFSMENLVPECSSKQYIHKIKKIQNYILSGDVYEVNLSMMYAGKFTGDPYLLFQKLYTKNPAPYSFFICSDDFSIVSNSPEMFLSLQDRLVETRPIKGTSPRSTDKIEDKKLLDTLVSSVKEQAELFMITDLLRNDLGKVCEFGSVIVINSKKTESYSHVHHLLSIIQGKLKEKYHSFDLLLACFPGGSITGCPKYRCMQIIEELENFSRNLYTGTLFIANKNFLVSNIAIRTAIIVQSSIFLNTGGAITIDSIPEMEYAETLHKLEVFSFEL
jgi:para-aminobenzoate synthetase component I